MTCDQKVELYYSGQWHDITADVRGSDSTSGGGADIRRGRAGESATAPPTSGSLVLANLPASDGAIGPYSVYHPLSAGYGKLGRNTPLRVYTGIPHVGAPNHDTSDTTSHVAPSVDAPTGTGLLLCAWGAPGAGSYTLPGGMSLLASSSSASLSFAFAEEDISTAGPTGTRTATFSVAEDYVAASVILHGPNPAVEAIGTSAAGSPFSATVEAGWWVAIASYWQWDGGEDPGLPDYPWSSREGGWIALADTGSVFVGDTDGDYIRMRMWAKRVKTTGEQNFGVALPSSVLEANGWAVVSGVGEYDIRGSLEVPSWPPRRDPQGDDRYVSLAPAGVRRRLERTQPPPTSPIKREVLSEANEPYLVAYWPCEDGSSATSVASALPSGTPMAAGSNIQMANYDGFGGSGPLPTLDATVRLRGSVPSYADGATFYRGLFAFPDVGLNDSATLLRLQCRGGDVYQFRLRYGAGGSLTLLAESDDGTELDSAGPFFSEDGNQFLLSVELVNDGANLDWLLFTRTVSLTGQVVPGVAASGTFGGLNIGRVTNLIVGGGTGTNEYGTGHHMIGNSQQLVFNISSPLAGWVGETAASRFLRLCREGGVAATVVGDPDDDIPLGFQRSESLFSLLDDVEAAGGGILYEPREFRGLGYRTLRSMYNQPPTATLDIDGPDRELAAQYEPAPDDYYIANDVTVERYGGSTARAEQETGPLNVGDPEDDPQAAGRYPPGSVQLALLSDADLPDHARWRLHLGTVDEPRWPLIVPADLLLALDEDSVAAVAALDVGDRLVLTNPPDDLPPDDISQIVIGTRELLDGVTRSVGLVARPERPFHIGEIEHLTYGLLGPDGARRGNLPISETQTGLTIFSGNTDWVHEADFDIFVGGERMTVTAVGSATGTFPNRAQLLTVVRGVNGVAKAHPGGVAIEQYHESYIGL